MIEVFNAISNIAENIEQRVFAHYDDLIDRSMDDETIHQTVYDYCSHVIEREFEQIKTVKGAISKDKKQYCAINQNGKYLITYVSIDNVELLDVNFSLGSIFGVYKEELGANNLVASIYITYGPTFQLVFASPSEGVMFFSHEHGEFIQQDSFTLNEKGKINSTAGMPKEWNQKHKELINSFFNEGYRLRFSDSLSLDTHQILFKKGGIYSSPATPSEPEGRVEILFEAMPIALIIELAGGEAIDAKGKRILDIQNPELHQKTPIYFGSKKEIDRVKRAIEP